MVGPSEKNSLQYFNLMMGIIKNDPLWVEAWIYYGADPNGELESQRGDPLVSAISNPKIFELLLKMGANANINQRPLRQAADLNNLWAVQKLFEFGVRLDADENYALTKFAGHGNQKAVEWILQNGGKVTEDAIDAANKFGKTKVEAYLRDLKK